MFTQAGVDPDHVPSARQVLTSLPEVRSSSYTELQVYVVYDIVTAKGAIVIFEAANFSLHCILQRYG